MSTTAGGGTAAAQEELWRRGLRFTPFVPAIPGAIAAVAPHPSAAWGAAVGALLAACVVLMALVVYGGLYDSPRWRGLYGIFNFDLLGFFTLAIVVRNLAAPRWVEWVLGAAFVATAAVGHLFRRQIMQELLAPRTRLGLAFAALGSIGAGGAGAIGYSTGRALPPVVLLGELFLGALVIALIGHSMWTKAEDPDWQPQPARRRSSR